jgi:ParB family chromosome partitioning protein
MIKMKGLGRGLDALLSGSDKPHGDEQRSLPVERLRPGKYQPRTQMDEASLAELAASIKSQGVMQPILARAIENTPGAERYEIVAGERRWRAAQLAGLAEVPVLIRNIPDEQALAMALIENIQRENLNPLEEAQGLQRLIDEFGLTHQQAADAVGRSRPAATNLLRLLQLTAAVQDMLMAGKLDMGHARALLPVSTAASRSAWRSVWCRKACPYAKPSGWFTSCSIHRKMCRQKRLIATCCVCRKSCRMGLAQAF